jgi:hypothetical protein
MRSMVALTKLRKVQKIEIKEIIFGLRTATRHTVIKDAPGARRAIKARSWNEMSTGLAF